MESGLRLQDCSFIKYSSADYEGSPVSQISEPEIYIAGEVLSARQDRETTWLTSLPGTAICCYNSQFQYRLQPACHRLQCTGTCHCHSVTFCHNFISKLVNRTVMLGDLLVIWSYRTYHAATRWRTSNYHSSMLVSLYSYSITYRPLNWRNIS